MICVGMTFSERNDKVSKVKLLIFVFQLLLIKISSNTEETEVADPGSFRSRKNRPRKILHVCYPPPLVFDISQSAKLPFYFSLSLLERDLIYVTYVQNLIQYSKHLWPPQPISGSAMVSPI